MNRFSTIDLPSNRCAALVADVPELSCDWRPWPATDGIIGGRFVSTPAPDSLEELRDPSFPGVAR